jgi:hypothetical protein
MKLAAGLVLLAALVGCGSTPLATCKDVDNFYVYHPMPTTVSSYYGGCNMECCSVERHDFEMCWCSKRCLCWQQHEPKRK